MHIVFNLESKRIESLHTKLVKAYVIEAITMFSKWDVPAHAGPL